MVARKRLSEPVDPNRWIRTGDYEPVAANRWLRTGGSGVQFSRNRMTGRSSRLRATSSNPASANMCAEPNHGALA